MGAEQHRHKQLYDCKVEGKPSKEGEMVCNRVYQIKWNLPPHKQQVVHFDRLKPYLNRQEEQGPTADQATMSDSEKTNEEVEDMYDDMSIQNGLGDEAITVVQHDSNVLPNNVPVQQEIVENDQTEEPEVNVSENEGLQDVTEEPIQQQGLHRSTRERRPPERLGTWIRY